MGGLAAIRRVVFAYRRGKRKREREQVLQGGGERWVG